MAPLEIRRMVLAVLGGVFFHEVVCQEHDVSPALPQGRQVDGKYIQAVEKIFPKFTFGDFLF